MSIHTSVQRSLQIACSQVNKTALVNALPTYGEPTVIKMVAGCQIMIDLFRCRLGAKWSLQANVVRPNDIHPIFIHRLVFYTSVEKRGAIGKLRAQSYFPYRGIASAR